MLVAILLVSIGIFGFAKMQALALSSTQVASSRSIVAMQAASLAAAMHGNRKFWGGGTAPTSFTTKGAVVTDTSNVLTATGVACSQAATPSTAPCAPDKLAAYDVQQWAAHMAGLLPDYSSTVTCSNTAGIPVSCVLNIVWTEKYVSISRSTASAPTSFATGGDRFYTLYIEP
ncbi:pilus assembly protein [Variovorax sp. PAMC26660]|uniref:pilus assembly protein n=1 Tax=Variovorax sp. PAMC26660 TaxID=2762322 RepID=UPI0021C26DF8|nr:pilus assembly protein [Variovorax sp. PAMC26660]